MSINVNAPGMNSEKIFRFDISIKIKHLTLESMNYYLSEFGKE